jgi:hypothetical protein
MKRKRSVTELDDDWPNFHGDNGHVVMGGKETSFFECLHCKATEEPVFPVDIKVFLKQMDDFLEIHKNCKEPENA